MMVVIGLCGFAGAGKDTVADYLVQRHGFMRVAFADPLKDVVCAIFGWDRSVMNGYTEDDRAFREAKDEWWSDQLGKRITPRNMMQLWGTEVGRKMFHPKLWIFSMQRKIETLVEQGKDIVVSDCRFVEECELIKKLGGTLVRIHRSYPEWYGVAYHEPHLMSSLYPSVHVSEYETLKVEVDHVIRNEGSKESLHYAVESIIILL